MEFFPSYEEIKKIADNDQNREYLLFMTIIGGYIRLQINNEYKNKMSIDYIQCGFLSGMHRNTKSNYKINKLYNINKKNYNGLMKLYIEILNIINSDINKSLNSREKHVV